MTQKKIVLLKLTGEVLLDKEANKLDSSLVRSIAKQIKQLHDTHYFGIVIGGGNFFRGKQHGTYLNINPSVGHQIGILATLMNGLIIKDIFDQESLPASLFCATPSPEAGEPISQQGIKIALEKKRCLIFSGGTGNPFFSTDTNSIVRALQIKAEEVWKGTNVNGVYDKDPRKNNDAKMLQNVSYNQMIIDNLTILDGSAIALAKTYSLPIKIFNIFEKNSLLKTAANKCFGSIIQ